MIIDVHTHAYPDDLSQRAVANMEKVFGLKGKCGGSVADLIAAMDQANIYISVLQGVALKPEHVPVINTWMAGIRSERVRCFGAMHPFYKDFKKEIKMIKGEGFLGIKFQPEFQDFIPTEERMYPFYEALIKEGLAVLFHAGRELSNPGVVHASAESLRKVHEMYPELLIIAGHFGGYRTWEDVETWLVGTDVLFDTACVFGDLDDASILRIIRAHGAERVLMGSDHPLFSSKEAVEGIKRLDLTEEEKSLILGENAKRIFKL